jgi:hypothetical protein
MSLIFSCDLYLQSLNKGEAGEVKLEGKLKEMTKEIYIMITNKK